MKKNYLILAFLIFSLAGCTQNENPVSTYNSPELNVQSDFSNLLLPPHNIDGLDKKSSVSKTITGKKGGTIRLFSIYEGGPFGRIVVYAALKFKPKSFEGTETISIIFDDENNFISFSPHKRFLEEAEFNMYLLGLDLFNVDENKVDFVYIAEDGTVEKVKYKKLKVDKKRGKVVVQKAKLNHFSRYGWVN